MPQSFADRRNRTAQFDFAREVVRASVCTIKDRIRNRLALIKLIPTWLAGCFMIEKGEKKSSPLSFTSSRHANNQFGEILSKENIFILVADASSG